MTVARVETPSGIVISSDEIDNEKTDTFYPFMLDLVRPNALPNQPEDFIEKNNTWNGKPSISNKASLP